MNAGIKYVHTNLIAKDWRKLADFYITVFDCKPSYPERDLSGEWMDQVTGIENVRVKGMHLILPGYENGPTLEIFSYEPEGSEKLEEKMNQHGFGHLAFHVEDVEIVLEKLIQNGGRQAGKVVQKQYETLGLLTVVYAADPEGNFIEIQNWGK